MVHETTYSNIYKLHYVKISCAVVKGHVWQKIIMLIEFEN